jgi:hypothetical protein
VRRFNAITSKSRHVDVQVLLRGRYKSGGDGIPIGALNVPPGSVVVAAGRILVEGIDSV